ncbi:ankyrin repeat, PH and SEC7 domain containing protein secG-like [Zophobas morio]|uniref:ankyrin repeat, PH and SEC7 domain containing protein secG-like n=1 Tax=Zophobas morio TaxID=2755281 RepID=UPI00308299BB
MGKTELVKSLKNTCSREYWTVLINPNDVNLFFRNHNFSKTENSSDLFIKFITNKKYESLKKIDLMFFEMCIKKNNVIYVWDALDEILNDNLDAALNIILHLSTKGFRQWVTSRRHLKSTLENKFNLLSLSINQFNEQEQEKYIRKRLESFKSEYNIGVTLEKIKSSFAIVEHIDILGIPLQIFMLTELFRENSEKYLKLMDNTFVLTDLYEYFIQEKFNNFYKNKMGYDLENPQLESVISQKKLKATEYYESVSFRVIFDEEITQRLNINYKKCAQKLLRSYASLGLVNDFQNDVPRFVHSSFAEYLVARYFSKNINNFKDTIADSLFDPRYNNVRFFFDMLLAKNSKAHIAVLYKRYELLKTYDDEILNRKDKGGRSALHLISSWGQRHPRIKVTREKNKFIVHENSNFDKKAETKIYFETMTYLQNTNDVGERDMLLDATPMTYARKSESLGAQIQLLQTKKNELRQSRDDIINIIYYSALLGYDDLCKHFTVEELNNFWRDVEIVAVENAETPLWLASENGNLKIVEYFVRSGVDINCVNIFGATPLYVASFNGHEKVVEYLATVGAEINRANKNGATPLYVASQNGHEKVVEYLATVGAEINRAMNNGPTPLYIASANGHEEVVEYLATVGAEINRATDNGCTPLYAASFNGHEKVVEYLATVGAEINHAINDRWTSLYAASDNGHKKIVEYLATVGADINRGDIDGWTPLYVATFNGHEKVVEYLTSVGAEINRADDDGKTPLDVASEKGHQKIVECLIRAGAQTEPVA